MLPQNLKFLKACTIALLTFGSRCSRWPIWPAAIGHAKRGRLRKDSQPALNGQAIPVVASGDMAAGGFESHVDRTPRIVALPDNA